MAGIAAIVLLVPVVFIVVNVANGQSSCSGGGSIITAAKDECTLAINDLRRVGSSSIACQPGECRDQWREGFASGRCMVCGYSYIDALRPRAWHFGCHF